MLIVSDRFPELDPVGPAVDGLSIPGMPVLMRIAAEAEVTDTRGVARETIDALAGAGLLGTALTAAAQRELTERIAGCDATTWFCWAQHQTPLRTLEGAVAGLREPASGTLTDELVPGLRSGHLLGAVAFAHVRRPGPANPVATRIDGGWRLDGRTVRDETPHPPTAREAAAIEAWFQTHDVDAAEIPTLEIH